MKAAASKELRRAEWIPAHALGEQELWGVKLVKYAMVDAYRMLARVERKVGPGRYKVAWPDHVRDYPAEKTKTSPYRTGMSVTRMEMVLCGWTDDDGRAQSPWLSGPLLSVPEYREKLEAWVFAELRGESTVDLCRRRKWAIRTAQWQRDRAAGMIADRLNRSGVAVW